MNEDIYNVLSEMSDQQFLVYLKNKYGINYIFVSLSVEEFERCQLIPLELIKDPIINPMTLVMKKLPKY